MRMTPKLVELVGEVTPIEISLDEDQNCYSSNKAGAGFEEYEGPAGEPIIAEEQNINSVLKNDCVNDQWWMKSKVHPPPKRRSVSAKRRYPPGCGQNPDFTVNNFDSKRIYCNEEDDIKEAILGKGVNDQWWMKSKMHPLPKRRSVFAIRQYPPGCSRNPDFTVNNFDSKRVYCNEEDDMKEAVLGKDVNAISDGVGGTNKKRKEICEAGVMDSMDGAVFTSNNNAKNDRYKDETSSLQSHAELVRDPEDRDVNSVMVKGVVKTALEDIAEERDVKGQNGNEKLSCAKRYRVGEKNVSVDSNSTLGAAQKKIEETN